MADSGAEGYTHRQLSGLEHLQFSASLPTEFSTKRDVKSFSVEVVGKSKLPPEIEWLPLEEGVEAYVQYFDLERFVITSKESGKTLDLVAITPKDWDQKIITLIQHEDNDPDALYSFEAYQRADVNRQECVINASLGPGTDNSNTVVLLGLWNTLIARFVQEVGNPVSEEGFAAMRESVLQKRSEILWALESNDDSNPQKIALSPFQSQE